VHVNHPNSFWVHFHDEESQRCLGILEDAIRDASNHVQKTGRPRSMRDVIKNHVYLAPHIDGGYYRARVER
jgi:hypothetical protein